VIDTAENIGTEAQNKLLKLLEEPPQYLQILLFCSNQPGGIDNLIKTIQSRCQIIELKTSPQDQQELEDFDPKLEEIANQLFGEQKQIKQGYSKLTKLLAQEKNHLQAQLLLKNLLRIMSRKNKSTANLNRAQKIQNLLDEIFQGINANVNPKLVVDKMFIELISI
jgi:DNA polymerase III gamma/tau subunit